MKFIMFGFVILLVLGSASATEIRYHQIISMEQPLRFDLAKETGYFNAHLDKCNFNHNTHEVKSDSLRKYVILGGVPDEFEATYDTGYIDAVSFLENTPENEIIDICNNLFPHSQSNSIF